MEPNTVQTQDNPPNNKRKIWIIGASIIFIALAASYFIYWLLVLQYQEYTDDAYVVGLQVPIVAQTTGNVTQVNYEETDLVKTGDVLVILDKTNAELAYMQAQHDLANVVRQTQELYINADQYQAEIQKNQITLNQAEADYKRRQVLAQKGVITVEDIQHARELVELARAALNISTDQYRANQALLRDTDVQHQPQVLQAADALKSAWIALQRTEIRSPVTGYVARRNVQIGSQVGPTTSLMAIVPTEPVWVNANFKETQLVNIKIGQPVSITSDLYGSDVVFKGTVAGLGMGTGSAFSVLPAQNATGNWIKVVQRLPVRVQLDSEQVKKYPLRIGLSTNATVDIKEQNGLVLAQEQRLTPAFESSALILDLAPVNAVIDEIIDANSNK